MSRKLPALNADNRAFWQGGEHGLLQIHKCNDCTRFFHPPGPICPRCASLDVAPCAASGKGKVLSYTLNYQPWHSDLEAPYVVALIDLAEQEGRRFGRNIVGMGPQRAHTHTPARHSSLQVEER